MPTTTSERAEDQVKRIVSIALGVSFASVKTTDSLVLDLNADSLDVYEIILDLEKAFDIEIPDDTKFITVGDLIEHVA
ncbi:acyl carrier protein [Caballeronia sp. KNU42]